LNKAVFLDRDGVLITERGEYNFQPEHMKINAGVFEALLQMQQLGYLLIVISNQGGISKGLYTHQEVAFFHALMLTEFEQRGIQITDIYYCPHHPDVEMCICRKPQALLLEKALARFDIDASVSFFIGDAERDMQAADAAGVKKIKIEANENLTQIVEFLL